MARRLDQKCVQPIHTRDQKLQTLLKCSLVDLEAQQIQQILCHVFIISHEQPLRKIYISCYEVMGGGGGGGGGRGGVGWR
jgi:hypothetical protein